MHAEGVAAVTFGEGGIYHVDDGVWSARTGRSATGSLDVPHDVENTLAVAASPHRSVSHPTVVAASTFFHFSPVSPIA